jgi:uncharacterized DUF497 family protein
MSRYSWDPKKAEANRRKHGVSFEEANEAIAHALAIEEPDIGHGDATDRLRITCWSPAERLLVVIVSTSPDQPRIISARRATKRERHAYEARP